jgi:phosphotransferase system  glucose/maltose/N-acetylglucosamine-specific IIC component
MKLFFGFLLGTYAFALFTPISRKKKLWVALVICLFVAFGYYFLNQI